MTDFRWEWERVVAHNKRLREKAEIELDMALEEIARLRRLLEEMGNREQDLLNQMRPSMF